MLYDCNWTRDMSTLQSVYLTSMTDFENVYKTQNKTLIKIAEVCGGEARTSRLATRHHLSIGPNFDIIVGVDLTTRENQHRVLKYFHEEDVLVAVMAPVCTPYGPMSHLNWAINPAAMEEQLRTARPIARLCGHIATCQLQKGRRFIQEQPHPSSLYQEPPWPSVLKDDRVVQMVYDRCMCGLRETGRSNGFAIKKPSSMTASCLELVWPFRNCRCNGRHTHAKMDGNGHQLSRSQVWAWNEAGKVVKGIELLLEAENGSLYASRSFLPHLPRDVGQML